MGSFLESPARGVGISPTLDQPIAEPPGTVIGHYKLLQQIGEGGMGVVYMAEQSEPVERRVALKIIKPGMDTRQVIARFEAEEQALAMMDHPNIAKVFDAGTTVGPGRRPGPGSGEDVAPPDPGPGSAEPIPLPGPFRRNGPTGRPYFVMELVKGIPITTYCDEQHLTPKERLQLFIPVCQAVGNVRQIFADCTEMSPTSYYTKALAKQTPPTSIFCRKRSSQRRCALEVY